LISLAQYQKVTLLTDGRRNRALGWKLRGFPVASSAYNAPRRPRAIRAEPVSILDIQLKQAQVDAQVSPNTMRNRRGNDMTTTS
jgi:hypothetical protein